LVLADRPESDVPRLFLGIADELGEPAMQRAPAVGVGACGDPRGEERMREADVLVLELGDPLGERRAEVDRLVGSRLDERDRRLGEKRRDLESSVGFGWQCRQSLLYEGRQRLRNGQRAPWDGVASVPRERA